MAAAPFCSLLGTLRDAALLLEPDLPTLRAFAELAMEFQPISADTPAAALTVRSERRCVGAHPASCDLPTLLLFRAFHEQAFDKLTTTFAMTPLCCLCLCLGRREACHPRDSAR